MDISQKHHELLIKTHCDSDSDESVGELHDKLEKYEKQIGQLEERNSELKEKNRTLKKQVKQLAKKAGIDYHSNSNAFDTAERPDHYYSNSPTRLPKTKALYKAKDVVNDSTSNSILMSQMSMDSATS